MMRKAKYRYYRRGIQRNFMGILEICGQVDSLLILPPKLFAIEQHAQVPVEYEMQALLLTKKQITSQ